MHLPAVSTFAAGTTAVAAVAAIPANTAACIAWLGRRRGLLLHDQQR